MPLAPHSKRPDTAIYPEKQKLKSRSGILPLAFQSKRQDTAFLLEGGRDIRRLP
jgi:hypothetical protein